MHSSTACAKHPTHFPGSGHFSSCCWGKVEGRSLMILSCQITDFLKQNHPWICGNDHGKRSDTSSALLPSFSVNCYLIQKVEPVFYRQAFLKNRCFQFVLLGPLGDAGRQKLMSPQGTCRFLTALNTFVFLAL